MPDRKLSIMGKRYYCDFCDRSFADTAQARKKHIHGVQHQRNRKLHYDSFKDPALLLAEESKKPPCRVFFQSGFCKFGAACKYSHMNPELLLAAQAERSTTSSQTELHEPGIEEWLNKWKKHQKDKQKREAAKTQEEKTKALKEHSMGVYMPPPGLPPVHELPPSLRPPPPGGFPSLPPVEWG